TPTWFLKEPRSTSTSPDATPTWVQGSTSLAFAGTGIKVNSVTVHSATTLTVSITVDAAAALGFRDVTVTTVLASMTETATGSSVVRVTAPITTPAILEVTPPTLQPGTTMSVVVRGVNTAWNATSTLTLGPGVTVTSVTVPSATEIDAKVQV